MIAQLFVTVAILALVLVCEGCTNFLASRGAVHDSSTIVAYNADSSYLYGSMYSYPAQKNIPAGTMRQIFDWDSGTCMFIQLTRSASCLLSSLFGPTHHDKSYSLHESPQQ